MVTVKTISILLGFLSFMIFVTFSVYQFDVVGQNYIVGPRRKGTTMSQIQHFDFNDDGSWLATVRLLCCCSAIRIVVDF